MILTALVILFVVLAWPVPRMMSGLTAFRRAPAAALVVWQATALAAVLAALFAAPVAIIRLIGAHLNLHDHFAPIAAGALVTVIITARLLLSGHQIGTQLRAGRRRHRSLVDLLAVEPPADAVGIAAPIRQLRVIEHSTPTAYCVPGLRRRVVLSQGTIDALPTDELDAVLSHERAHLRFRHDLILEFFTVIHEAVPRYVRSEAALQEVNLLIEVLADRAAVRTNGAVATGRAIVRMASTGIDTPAGALAMSSTPSAASIRLGLLMPGKVAGMPPRVASVLMYTFAAAVIAMPLALLTLALTWA